MKSYLLSLFICFTSINLGLAFATEEQKLACLHDNGLNNSTDVELFQQFIRSNSKDEKEFYLEKQFTCAVACILNLPKRPPPESIYQQLMGIIRSTDQFHDGLKRDMMYRLEHCRQQDEGDDCKLLHCVKILRSPFKELLSSLD